MWIRLIWPALNFPRSHTNKNWIQRSGLSACKRLVIEYLLSPLQKAAEESLKER